MTVGSEGGRVLPRRWSRLEVVRYGLISITLGVGVWQFDPLTAACSAVVAYLSAPFLAHPTDAWHYQRRSRAQRRYAVSLTRSGVGDPVDLGDAMDQVRRAIAGELRPFRVFISSTFSDLTTERDLLAKEVFPRIARECEKRGAIWAPIDLRWGITELQQNAGDVIRICLDSVERSRPNTIGIIGSRYGSHVPFGARDRASLPSWLTEDNELSVTHLELRYARHGDPPALAVFVMERQPASHEDGVAIASMLRELRVGAAQVVDLVPNEHDLAELVHADLLRRLDREAPETGFDNHLLREISAHAMVERQLAERPKLNSGVLEEVALVIEDGRTAVLRGEPGSGRSTLLAAWAQAWRRDHPEDIVITRFVGLTDESQTWPQVLRSVVAEISLRTGQPIRLPPRDEELAVSAAFRILELQSRHRVVIGIDGLDHFQTRNEMEHLNSMNLAWLPQQGPATRLKFIPTLVTTRLGEEVDYAHVTTTIDVPLLEPRDRSTLVTDSLIRVDRNLTSEAIAALIAHPRTGHPAFLSLLLDELHKTPSHADMSSRLEELLSTHSTDDLVRRILDRVEIDLGLERFDDLHALLTLLAVGPVGYTEVQIVGILAQCRPAFGQTELAALRWRLTSLLSEVAGTLSARGAFRAALLATERHEELDARIRAARLSYFCDRERRLTPRSFRELTLMSDGPAAKTLHEIVTDPEGLAALRSAQGSGYQFVLAAVARYAGCRVGDLLKEAASEAGKSTADVRLAVAQTCHDYGEYDLAIQVLDAPEPNRNTNDGDAQSANLALRGRLALLGKYPFTDGDWDLLFDLGAQQQSTNAQTALSGMGVSLAQRGDFFWAKKYFDRAAKLAFATGDVGGVALAGVNSSITALEGVENPLRSSLGPVLHGLFDRAAAIGLSAGDIRLTLEGLFRRSVLDLVLGRPEAAHECFSAIEDLASELGHERFVTLARMGRASALRALGQSIDGDRLAERLAVDPDDLLTILQGESLNLLI